MRSPAVERGWRLVGVAGAGLLAFIALLLVPLGHLPYPPQSAYSDAAIAHWPAAYFLRESVWRFGAWPLWNPLRMLGQPFAANPLNKVWYPPQWLVLILPPTLHLNLLIYLHMAWLALGMALWLRAEGLHPFAGAFGMLAWGLNPKLMAHLGAGHLDLVYALAWTPWLLWAVRRGVDEKAHVWPNGVRIGVVAALLALADLRVAFYMLPLAAIYGVVLGSLTPNLLVAGHAGAERRTLALGTLALAIFLLLTAVQTAPLVALAPHLTRAAITPQEAAVYSLPPRYLLGLLFADTGGFHEWMTYLGLPVLVLAAAALTYRQRRTQKALWLIIAALALLWALGEHGPLFPLAARLPLVGWFRVPSRAWLVTALGLTALAAQGLDDLLAHPLGRVGRLTGMALAAGGVVWLVAALAFLPEAPPNVRGFGAALAGTGIGLWLLSEPPGMELRLRVGGGSAVLIGTLVASLLLLDRTLVEGRLLADVESSDEALITALGEFCDTVYSPSFVLIGPAAVRAGIPTLHGADPFQLRWSAEAIAQAAGVEWRGYSVTAPPLPSDERVEVATDLLSAHPDAERLAALGVRWVVASFPLHEKGLTPHGQVGALYLYETSGGPPTLIAPQQVDAPLKPLAQRSHSACNRHPNRLLAASYDTLPAGGGETAVLVLPQTWAPGWRAWVDGQAVPVQRVGGVLVGVEVPALGPHHVEVVYRPLADFVGMGLTGSGLLVSVGGFVRRRWL